MVALIVIAFLLIPMITFIIIRLSISCMFWISKNPENKMHVFKLYFPYYVIILFGICIAAIIRFEANLLANYYFGLVFFTAIAIWWIKLKSSVKKVNENFAVEPNQTHLP